MGSFNVACSVSNISIDAGDPAVYIPLQHNRLGGYKIADGNNMLIYSNCFYNPATLPIKGTYDDYGRIAVEKDDEVVMFIEKYFDKPIDLITDMNGNDERVPGIDSGMFVHGSIYNLLASKCISEFGKPEGHKSILNSEYELLKRKIPETRELINQMYPDNGGDNKMADMMFPSMLERECRSGILWRDSNLLKKMVLKAIEEGILKEQIIEFKLFEVGMYHVNVFYFPAMNGLQFGNPYMSKELYARAHDLMQAKILRREDEY